MRTVVYRNKWPWGEDIIHVAEDGKSFVGISKQDGTILDSFTICAFMIPSAEKVVAIGF